MDNNSESYPHGVPAVNQDMRHTIASFGGISAAMGHSRGTNQRENRVASAAPSGLDSA
jgi:hypothetical protein